MKRRNGYISGLRIGDSVILPIDSRAAWVQARYHGIRISTREFWLVPCAGKGRAMNETVRRVCEVTRNG